MTPKERNLADIGLIALRHGLTRFDILGRGRTRKVVRARQDCVFMFYNKGFSLTSIGRIMDRNHTTIMFSLGQYKKRTNPGIPGASAGLI